MYEVIQFILSHVDKYLGYFQCLALTMTDVINILVYMDVHIHVLKYIHKEEEMLRVKYTARSNSLVFINDLWNGGYSFAIFISFNVFVKIILAS